MMSLEGPLQLHFTPTGGTEPSLRAAPHEERNSNLFYHLLKTFITSLSPLWNSRQFTVF